MSRNITFKGSPLTLVGRTIETGKQAPYFRVVSQDLKEVTLSQFEGKVKVVTFFPSLDTPVCDQQVKEFNKRSAALSPETVVLGISKDLPFAQKRFCQENDIEKIAVLSDYKTSSFGINYGVLIKELNLLARGVLIIDAKNTIRYFQVVGELTAPPDYEAALSALEDVIKKPQAAPAESLSEKCLPCEGKIAPLPREKVETLMAHYRGWKTEAGQKLEKEFTFKDFPEAKYFLDLVSVISEEQNHHPNMLLKYNKVKIILTTHAAGGLTENDFIMARIIDTLQV